MTLFIGNLSATTGERDLRALFTPFGEVEKVNLVYDRFTHRSRGFGYVEMTERSAGESAIARLNNHAFQGRSLVVNEVRDKGAAGTLT